MLHNTDTVISPKGVAINTKAVVLCAGLGTRLRPLTEKTPKPMIKVGGQPVLHYIMASLNRAGITQWCINLHWLPLKIMEFFYPLTTPVYSPETKLLGTAGALKKMETWLSDPFLVVNGDTITNVDLEVILRHHSAYGTIATVFTKGDAIHSGGIYVFNKEVLRYIPKTRPYSIDKDLIPKLIKKKTAIYLYDFSGSYYFDIGTPEKLAIARRALRKP